MSLKFLYEAVDASGKTVKGTVEAANSEEAGTWLSDRGYYVLDIKSAPIQSIVQSNHSKRLPDKTLNFFFIQLSSLVDSGCPLLMSIDALAKQSGDKALRRILTDIGEMIRSGKSFSESLKAHGPAFPELFITMVEVGETGGVLDLVLKRYSYMFDSSVRLKNKMVKALIYPSALCLMTILVAWAVLVFVFPKIIGEIGGDGSKLPLPTLFILRISNFLSAYYIHIFVALFVFALLYIRIRKTEKGAQIIDSFFLKFSGIGSTLKQLQTVLFARTLGILIGSGVPILTSIQAVSRTLNNYCYKNAMKDVGESVSRGEAMSQALMRHSDLFSETMILMVVVGEQTGNIGDMLERMGVIYERDLESSIEYKISLLEPALVVFISIFVVTLALAVYLPIFDIQRQMSGRGMK